MEKTGKSQKIAVLGAGITGLMIAYNLRAQGHDICIYDPDGLPPSNQNASAKAGGMLAPYSEIEHMSGRWVSAGLESINFWRGLPAHETGFNNQGSLLIAHDADHYILDRFTDHLRHQDDQSFTAIRPEELEPALQDRFTQGAFLKSEAHLIPSAALSFLARSFTSNIKEIATKPQDLNKDFDWVIDCRGMGAAPEMALPLLRGVKGEMAIVRNPEFTLNRPVRLMHPRYPLYIVPRPDHIFMIGATIIESEQDESVSLRSAMELMSALYTLHPSFAQAQLIEFSAGIRPSYIDNLPRISVQDNIIAANGMFRHGFLLSPIMAQSISDHIAGQTHQYWDLFIHGHDKHNHQRAA